MRVTRIPHTFVTAGGPFNIGRGELIVLALVLVAVWYFFGPGRRGR
jgi:hypothetical protein